MKKKDHYIVLKSISGKLQLVLIFLLYLCSTQAQVKNIGLPKIINYKKFDYKGGSQNWDVGQDKNGNMYFANTSGLIQFNGTSWNVYPIPNITVRSLKVCSSSGRVYVGGYNEFGYFDTNDKGKLIYHSLTQLVSTNAKKFMNFIWKIHIVDDAVFFQTFDRTYIYKNNKLTVLEAPNRFQFSFRVGKSLYFQDVAAGLHEYKNGRLLPLPNTAFFNSTEIWAILPIKDKLLIVTLDKGLYMYHNGAIEPWESQANEFVKKNNSLGGRIMNDKFIVFNSVLDGIIVCDMNGKILQHINNKKGLQNNTALSSFIDDGNNIWLGLDNGIGLINENSPFTYLGSSYDLSAVYGSAVADEKLYAATNQGVFIHDWTDIFKEESFKFIKGTTGQAWNIQQIGGELFCSHNRGLFLIKDGEMGPFLDDKKGYFGVKEIPGKPNYLIASNYIGFAVLEKTPQGWKYRNQIEGFSSADFKFVTDDKHIWIKKDNFVYQLKLSNDLKKVNLTVAHEKLTDGLEGISSVQKLNNTVYFQTNNRFFTYSQTKDRFIEDKKMTALFSNVPQIRYCFEDSIGNICYFFGDSSMGMLMKEGSGYKNVLSPFSSLTGDLVFYYESVNTVNSKNIFIGLTEGLVHYNPQLHDFFFSKPKAFIRSFSFPGDTIIAGNLEKAISYKVPYSDNNVRFTFSSPVYENPQNTQFSYKLEGFDSKWSPWTSVTMKEYTNLHEGSYEMKVKVKNSYGIESPPDVVTFAVAPPFYRHPIAYLSYLLISIASFFIIRAQVKYKIRKNKYYETIEQRKLYLEKEARIKQEQFELEKEIERLNNEKLKYRILAKDKELVNNSLQVAKKNKILNSIIHKLKEIDGNATDEATRLQLTKLHKSIMKEIKADKGWNNLEKHIKNVHFEFLKRLKANYPDISPRELDLATYLLMNMSTKEIAEIMNISSGGVELARYRLRKKLGLKREENLVGFLMNI